ncbi:MAG: glutamate--tRNA ligase [Alphaproteobacteria bacterium]|nr:glutamate--tRNA ligase [Alphaproteobacteria bacterium]
MTLAEVEALYPPRKLPEGAEVTRIAPSPTGMPHIGTGMQAVLDRALADKSGGVFILRIEDTDLARTQEGAVEAIIDGLRWLGAMPDEGDTFGGDYGPYTQTARLPLYRLAAQHLVEQGHAYHCFCTAERLELVRKTQVSQHQSPGYDGHCRNLDPAEVATRLTAGEKNVIRLKVPKDETISFHDEVRGNISFEASVIDDSVLLKSDGIPTYHLAAAVDDHFMRVTTVVRGEEWISSTPKHILVYRYLGWEPPKFLHTVLLRDKNRRKLSKRSGDTSLTWFRKQGIMPAAFRNFLYRIMWAHPEGKDIYPMSEFAEKLQVSGLPSTGPVADMDLLSFINGRYMNELSAQELEKQFMEYLDFLIASNLTADDTLHQDQPSQAATREDILDLHKALREDPKHGAEVLQVVAQRCARFGEIIFGSRAYFDYGYTPPAPERMAKECPDAAKRRRILEGFLEAYASDAQAPEVEGILKAIGKELGLKDRAVFMTLRLAMTGVARTPPLSEVAALLKLERVKKRLAMVLETVDDAPAAQQAQ